ncbi:MAG: hypothetical protein PHI19_02120 [Clostridia bacterium]|nr:hypothetical protein [Clostridia bacterium]
MKRVKITVIILLLAAITTVFLTGCNIDMEELGDRIQDAVNNAHEYSEDGFDEINTYLGTINTYKEWEIRVYEESTSQEFTLKYYADKTDGVKEKYVLGSDEMTMAYLKHENGAASTEFFINETTKKAYMDTTPEEATNAEGEGGADFIFLIQMIDYCLVDLDGWNFVQKRDDRSITYQEITYDTVEYEYSKTPEESTAEKLVVNYKTILVPLLLRISYGFFVAEETEPIKAYDIYVTFETEEVTLDNFAFPTTEEGYQLL